jgi:WhiB family redox-sensing transcriptional regulator
MTPYEWMSEALCLEIDSTLFFPDEPNAYTEGKKACELCTVKTQCLEYALKLDVVGIWGGTTETERRKMKKNARAAA